MKADKRFEVSKKKKALNTVVEESWNFYVWHRLKQANVLTFRKRKKESADKPIRRIMELLQVASMQADIEFDFFAQIKR